MGFTGVTMLNYIVDDIGQCGQQNIVQGCFQNRLCACNQPNHRYWLERKLISDTFFLACRFRCQSNGKGLLTWSMFIRTAPFPSKASLLLEAKRKNESEMVSNMIDW